jgi:hypothetical protein
MRRLRMRLARLRRLWMWRLWLLFVVGTLPHLLRSRTTKAPLMPAGLQLRSRPSLSAVRLDFRCTVYRYDIKTDTPSTSRPSSAAVAPMPVL